MQLEKVLEKYERKADQLIEILLDVQNQKKQKYLTEAEIELISSYLNIPASQVCSVMSFYTLLSDKKRGEHIIQICKDVPCYLNDDFNVLATVENALNIKLGGTTKDGLFTLENTACIGCCDEAPAMRINHKIYTNLTKAKVLRILEEYKEGILC
jgi:NADH-quinone oxidoreductase subunit E